MPPNGDRIGCLSSGVGAEAVRAQVERVTGSQVFSRCERLKQFLRFVVEETLLGRGRDLKGYTVGVSVFGRRDDFDPIQDPIVRVAAQRLRRALKLYYLCEGRYEPLRIELPKGQYAPILKQSHDSARAHVAAEPLPQRGSKPVRIAVLPFKNLSADPGLDHFAEGITEELAVLFGRSPDLEVVSRYSIAYQKIMSVPLHGLSKRLGARLILGGSVRRNSHTARVTAQLNDTSTGSQIWAGKFDRKLTNDNALEVQEEIAQRVVSCVEDWCGGVTKNTLLEEA